MIPPILSLLPNRFFKSSLAKPHRLRPPSQRASKALSRRSPARTWFTFLAYGEDSIDRDPLGSALRPGPSDQEIFKAGEMLGL